MIDNPEIYEASIKRSKAVVATYEAFQRLRANRDYKAVFEDGYLRDEAVRLVHLRADPSRQSAASQAEIIKQIDGISALVSFFLTLEHNHGQALKTIESDEASLEMIRGGNDDD